MKRAWLLAGAALALPSAWALAQEAPESLLPPGFDEPPQRAAPAQPRPAAPGAPAPAAPAPAAAGAAGGGSSSTSGSGGLYGDPMAVSSLPPVASFDRLPSLDELERMSPDELEDVLGLKPKFDIPPGARRSLEGIGIIDESEGGLPERALAGQDASLVRAALAGNRGTMVSRWGHILLRRALASRLDAPLGMNPADFAALRAALLLRMGEGEAARTLVQDVDNGNYTPALTDAAFDAYVATADFTGACPVIALHEDSRRDAPWEAARAICESFRGEGSSALSELDRQLSRGSMERIDLLLAQRYAGAAGKSRRAVTIEWDGVNGMTPWRYGLAIAVGLEPPASAMKDAPDRFAATAATAPMLGLAARAGAADRAAARGILSSAAMVDLYSQLYSDEGTSADWVDRAEALRDAYVAAQPAARLAAMQKLWDGAGGAQQRYSRMVATAFAAARLPVAPEMAEQASDLVASMLTAGLDRNALAWGSVAKVGTQAWALLALAAPSRSSPVEAGALESYLDDDASEGQRKSAFLVAGLAGLGRISPQVRASLADSLQIDLTRSSRWTRMIDRAAEVDNPALVALLAGLGMQGDSWARMTPRYLFHIVAALRRVGLEAEARMIAAEAVARA